MNLNAKPSEICGVVGVIDPDVSPAAAYSTGWVAAKNYNSFLAVILAGTLGASATVDAKLEQATSSGGAGVKDITGKAITQLTQAGTDDDKQALINLRPEEMDVDGGFTHVRLTVTVAVATSDLGAVLLGFHPARGPATAVDATTVDEVVA